MAYTYSAGGYKEYYNKYAAGRRSVDKKRRELNDRNYSLISFGWVNGYCDNVHRPGQSKGEMIKMRNREMSLQDHGVFPGDEEKLKKRCHCLSIEERLRLFQCVISAAPGLEMPVYESLTTGVGYRTIAHRGYSIPVKEDDFYAYKRKALAEFYEWLRMTGRWKD